MKSRRIVGYGAFLFALCLLAASGGCSGFFVNPTLTSVSISPADPSLQSSGQTVQLTATGNFDDGTTQPVTDCSWTSSDPTTVSVSSSGLATAHTSSTSTATITANCTSNGSATGTVTVTIGQTSQGSLVITSSLGNSISLTSDPAGTSISFTASLNGTDVTAETTFTSSSSSVISLTSGDTSLGTLTGSMGTVTITGSGSGGTGSTTITVGP